MPDVEYAALIREVWDASTSLLRRVRRESHPRYFIVPQVKYRWVRLPDGKKSAERTDWEVWICDGRDFGKLAVVRSDQEWELIKEAFSGEGEGEQWWIAGTQR